MRVSRREFLGATAAATLAAHVPAHAAGQRLNLLWIMTDQQPVSTVGAYGNPTIKTPHLDRIAAEGLRFNRFHISAFPCSPSRACFLTGRHAHNHGVTTNDVPLAPEVPAIGDVLKAAGYNTGYIGKWHLSGSMYRMEGRKPFDGRWYFKRQEDPARFRYEKVEGGTGEDAPQHGFDTWVGGWKHFREYLREVGLGELVDTTPVGNHNDAPSGPDSTHAYSKLPEEHHMAAFFANRATSFLNEQKDGDRPFGLVVSFYGPHLPVAPPKPWDDMYPLADVPLPANHYDELKGKPIRQRMNDRCYELPNWTDEQFRDYIRRYWGYCSYIDQQVGRVLDALEASGKADDTIVLFTSDHGDMVAAHGFVYKLGHCGYDELLRVPFLLRCPGRLKAGSQCDDLVAAIDVLPTLLELMDIAAPAGIDGHSFLPTLRDPKVDHREVVVCNSMDRNATVITDRWKYVLNWEPRDLDELYDLQKDPGEMTNLSRDEACADVVGTMRKHIETWLTETNHPYKASVLAAMAEEVELRVVDLWPEITAFKMLGDNELEYSYTWHAADAPGAETRYWSFTHFANPKYGSDGDIVFRDTTWPDPPTTAWKPGTDHLMGPIRVRIPKEAGPGKYAVHIGLYDPETRTGPGHLLRGQNNRAQVGELTIQRDGDAVTKAEFQPVKRPK
jgi:arylsulfatase A-like enzyme